MQIKSYERSRGIHGDSCTFPWEPHHKGFSFLSYHFAFFICHFSPSILRESFPICHFTSHIQQVSCFMFDLTNYRGRFSFDICHFTSIIYHFTYVMSHFSFHIPHGETDHVPIPTKCTLLGSYGFGYEVFYACVRSNSSRCCTAVLTLTYVCTDTTKVKSDGLLLAHAHSHVILPSRTCRTRRGPNSARHHHNKQLPDTPTLKHT